MLTGCWQDRDGTPDDEQQACSKHAEAYNWNKLIENSASGWFILYGYITMQVNKTLKVVDLCSLVHVDSLRMAGRCRNM